MVPLSRTFGHERAEVILGQFSVTQRRVLLADSSAAQALFALSAFSSALTQALASRPSLARWLFLGRAFEQSAVREDMRVELAGQVRDSAGLEDLQAGLRVFRLRELARLAVRDLTGRAYLAEVMATLTALADACLGLSLEVAVRLTAERFGLTPGELGISPIILGMGKLGGEELNYSSDVDLIYLYRRKRPAPKAPPPEESADIIFTTVTRAMSDLTEDGLVFRVDLDLRPGGKDGALAQDLETARKHYLLLGQPWERLVLLKARSVAGDLDAAGKFLSDLMPFIFRHHLDYTAIEELKALKARFTKEKSAKMVHISGPGQTRPVIDVKLSPGGIREIEFFVQTLTLTFGGRLPHLRKPDTLGALQALTGETIITAEDAGALSQAYVFLRAVEHRLQLRELTQTQLLPRTPSAQEVLAWSMGFSDRPWKDFEKELKTHMGRVKIRFTNLLTEPGEGERQKAEARAGNVPDWAPRLLDNLENGEFSVGLLRELGFQRPEAAWTACRNIREERFLPDSLSRYRRQLEHLLPVMMAGAAAAPDPDRAILHLERFLVSIGPKAGFFVLLEENPRLINVLSTLFGSSDYLSGVLINHPGILDSLIDRRAARLVKNKAAMVKDLDTALDREEDPESRLGIIRRFKNDEILRIGLYDLLGELTLPQVQNQLTGLAEVVMNRTLGFAIEQIFLDRKFDGPLPLAVMGLGKAGGRELSYGSDLDIIFVLGRGRGTTHLAIEDAVRLAQRLTSFLSVPLAEGPGYSLDSRLRPSGGGGSLIVTPASFARYHQTSRLWERQALLKTRRLVGPKSLGSRMRTLASRAIFVRDLPEDAKESIDRLRRRMTQERGRLKSGEVNLKFSPGGLIDLEFITQSLQLVHGRRHKGGVRSATTRMALGAMVRKGLGPKRLAKVLPAYELISRVANRLGLIYARYGDTAAYTLEEIGSLNLAVTGPDPVIALRSAMDLVQDVYAEVFGREAGHAG